MPKWIVCLVITLLLKQCFANRHLRLSRVKRIIGGTDAPEGSFPYQISLRTRDEDFHFCSGSIVRASVILTAAHCVHGKKPSNLKIIAGSHSLTSGGTVHSIVNVTIHNKFNRTYFQRDLALLVISPPIIFSHSAKAIVLETLPIEAGTDATFSGWGQISEDLDRPYNYLQFIKVKSISLNVCRKRSPHWKTIRKGKICTLPKKGKGACYYDSGGPLVANQRLIGILSCGKPCAKNYPDIYVKVSGFIKWINRKIAAYGLDSS